MPKYGPKAQEEVKEAMHEMKEGTLKSGGKSKKNTTPDNKTGTTDPAPAGDGSGAQPAPTPAPAAGVDPCAGM